MLDVISRATRWIHFENYIIRSDAAGWRFAELLAARARDGVSVRVLYDWFGSFGTSRGFWNYLRKAGVEVRAFHPPQLVDVVTNVSRNHRKLVVADGSRGVLGGLCIGCEWTGESHAQRPTVAGHGRRNRRTGRCSSRSELRQHMGVDRLSRAVRVRGRGGGAQRAGGRTGDQRRAREGARVSCHRAAGCG